MSNINQLNKGRIVLFASFALIAFAANSVLNRLALGGNTIDASSYIAIRLISGAITLALIHGFNKMNYNYMNASHIKNGVILYVFFFFLNTINAQITPQKIINEGFISTHFNDSLMVNKSMDSLFMTQIKGALLFYPELKNKKIKFRIKNVKSPLAARPTFWAILQKPENRTYLITISKKTSETFEPILLKNLSFNAQIGVLGHELSHIAFYDKQKGFYFIRLVFMQLSTRAMDNFENDTDKRCIEHGLGYQLLAWSTEVREKLHIKTWKGVDNNAALERERYMSPASILKLINYVN